VLDVDHEMPQLRSIATTFERMGGHFWVADRDGVVVACGGWAPTGGEGGELKHLYVASDARRNGLGTKLTKMAEEAAIIHGKTHMELWSDTRFLDAHRLYEGLGYFKQPDRRELHDLSHSIEFHYSKRL
jgi:putative acetyltransferase